MRVPLEARHQTAVFLRYDTGASCASFAKSRQAFENRGLKLGPVDGLGDEATTSASPRDTGSPSQRSSYCKGNSQILTTGTGEVDQIGAISRHALTQYEAASPLLDLTSTQTPTGPFRAPQSVGTPVEAPDQPLAFVTARTGGWPGKYSVGGALSPCPPPRCGPA